MSGNPPSPTPAPSGATTTAAHSADPPRPKPIISAYFLVVPGAGLLDVLIVEDDAGQQAAEAAARAARGVLVPVHGCRDFRSGQ